MKLLPYILFENYIYILALEMATQGTSTVPIVSAHFRSLLTEQSPHRAGAPCGDYAESLVLKSNQTLLKVDQPQPNYTNKGQ